MAELELSIMSTAPDPEYREDLQELLKQFEAEHNVQVRINVITWTGGWAELVKIALYGYGADVSEVGTTWVGGFTGMDALIPFSKRDIRALGGPSAFLPGAWQSVSLAGEKQIWAIPWLAGTRVIFCKRDLLEKAGVNEQTAFETHQQLEQTLELMQVGGIDMPWVVPTQSTLNTLHYVSSWVWGAGGAFLSDGGKRPLFNQEAACAGMCQYFSLGRYLPQLPQDLDDNLTETLFWEGKAAITIGGQWVLNARKESAAPQILDNLVIAPVPGVSFVGGSNLVIWKHTRQLSAARELVRFLTRPQIQIPYSQCVGLYPTRTEALKDPSFGDDPLHQIVSQGLKTGRSFPSVPTWGLLEDKLVGALAQIWTEVLSDPHSDPMDAIKERLDTLANRVRFALRTA